MSETHDPPSDGRDETPPSVDQIARLDAALDDLVRERRPAPAQLSAQEAREQMLAAQLRLAREGVEEPTAAFLASLEAAVGRAVEETARPRRGWGLSRGGFLRTVATLAGGAGLGVAGVEGAAVLQQPDRPHELIEDGNGRWYPIAAVGEVAPGSVKPFSAGGVMGFLLNSDGQLHAVSAICTHMGCRLKPTDPARGAVELYCLCHGSRFNGRGAVLRGLAPSALPAITLRELNGHIYALGTSETV